MGRVLDKVKELPDADNTYIIFMSDNGWFIGDHLFTSKVLAYEESIRVPLIITGPDIQQGRNQELVLNIDIFPTLLEILGEKIPDGLHGKSLLKSLKKEEWPEKRTHIYYEAPSAQLGSRPLAALRTDRYKYIETYQEENLEEITFQELYDLNNDPHELENLASEEDYHKLIEKFTQILENEKKRYR
jgi:arylsulfatase A-like enzyme